MDAVTSNAPIDPKLSEAIRHWNDYANESGQNVRVLFEAMTPVKDSLQIAQQIMDSVQHRGWTPGSAHWMKPAALFSAYQELTEIQLAAQERENDCCIRFLTTTLGTGKQVAEAMQGASTPQQVLASCMEASLNIVRQYQADISEQAETFSQIQSAYKAWLQRTLDSLSSRQAEETAASASLPPAASEPSLPVPATPSAQSEPEKDSGV